MTIKSKYSNKCKDCGLTYDEGEDIDINGIKSPNQNGEWKDHWCKMGNNCQGVQKFDNGSKSFNTGGQKPKEPNITELYERFIALKEDTQKLSQYQIIEAYIEQLQACETMGITNLAVIGMLFSNRIRNRQS